MSANIILKSKGKKENMNNKTKEIYQYWYNQYKNEIANIGTWIEKAKNKYSISTQKVIAASMKYYVGEGFKINVDNERFVHKIKTITQEEYTKVYGEIINDNGNISRRNRLVLRVLWETGIRVSELLNMKWEDVGEVYIKIVGKGGVGRMVPYKHDLFSFQNEKNKSQDFIFLTPSGGQLSYSSVYALFQKYKAVINKKSFSPHVMRHSFASRLIGKNIGIEFLSKIMGHASINTTMLYIHFNDDSIKKFINMI